MSYDFPLFKLEVPCAWHLFEVFATLVSISPGLFRVHHMVV